MIPENLKKICDEGALNWANDFYPDSKIWDSKHGNAYKGFKAGAEFMYETLLGMGAEFDEKEYREILKRHFLDSKRVVTVSNMLSLIKTAWIEASAISSAQLAAKDLRIAELENSCPGNCR